jgi:hypothetical protein
MRNDGVPLNWHHHGEEFRARNRSWYTKIADLTGFKGGFHWDVSSRMASRAAAWT